MKKGKMSRVVVLFAVCIFCIAFALACSPDAPKKVFTVTFMDNDTVYARVEVEMGKRVTLPNAPTRTDENNIFDGWYLDEDASNAFNEQTERITGDLIVWSNFLYVANVPGNVSMDSVPFSSTVTWLQRGIDDQTEFSVKLFKGMLVSQTDYAYSTEATTVDSNLSGANQKIVLTPYKNHSDIYTVKYTPETLPTGGVYSAEIVCGQESVTKTGLYFKGAGTQTNPYILTDANDLAAVNTKDTATGGGYIL